MVRINYFRSPHIPQMHNGHGGVLSYSGNLKTIKNNKIPNRVLCLYGYLEDTDEVLLVYNTSSIRHNTIQKTMDKIFTVPFDEFVTEIHLWELNECINIQLYNNMQEFLDSEPYDATG